MNDNTNSVAAESLSIALARIFWIMIGPLALALFVIGIVSGRNGWFTPSDFGFLGVLGGIILARVWEFRGGNPRTSTGEPAQADDLRRYIIAALLVGLGVWAAANLIANHWLGT